MAFCLRSHHKDRDIDGREALWRQQDGRPMQTYRIEETSTGWAMFQSRRTRPTIEAGTKEELLKKAAHLLAGKQASIRIENSNGKFQELRF